MAESAPLPEGDRPGAGPPCPTCGTPLAGRDLATLPHFPFCSRRCRLVDLGQWLDGGYVISGPAPEDSPDAT